MKASLRVGIIVLGSLGVLRPATARAESAYACLEEAKKVMATLDTRLADAKKLPVDAKQVKMWQTDNTFWRKQLTKAQGQPESDALDTCRSMKSGAQQSADDLRRIQACVPQIATTAADLEKRLKEGQQTIGIKDGNPTFQSRIDTFRKTVSLVNGDSHKWAELCEIAQGDAKKLEADIQGAIDGALKSIRDREAAKGEASMAAAKASADKEAAAKGIAILDRPKDAVSCADEGKACRLVRPASDATTPRSYQYTAYFGANGRYVKKWFAQKYTTKDPKEGIDMKCDNGTFGFDPMPGVAKACFVVQSVYGP